MPETIKLTKTIVLKSRPLTKTKIKIIENIIEMYKDVLSIALNFGLKNKRKSHRKIREGIYEEIKNKYPKLPTHYIYTASQDASTRIKSFIAMRNGGKAYTSKPEVRNVSLWLDDVLFNYKDFKTNIERLFSINKEGKKTLHLRLSTPDGRIVIPLKPHKQFFKLLNEGWKIKAGFKLRLNKEDGTIAVLIPLENEITINDNFKEKQFDNSFAYQTQDGKIYIGGEKAYLYQTIAFQNEKILQPLLFFPTRYLQSFYSCLHSHK